MNGVVAKLIDAAVAEATAPLLVELAEAKVLLAKRDDEVAVYLEEISELREHITTLTTERDDLQWAAEWRFADLDNACNDQPELSGEEHL